jgi:hypothetical protein
MREFNASSAVSAILSNVFLAARMRAIALEVILRRFGVGISGTFLPLTFAQRESLSLRNPCTACGCA